MVAAAGYEFPFDASARRWAERLVGWMSVTGTEGEAEFPHRLAGAPRSDGYFLGHSDSVHLLALEGDVRKRSSLLAWVRARGRRTVVLTGHFDVRANSPLWGSSILWDADTATVDVPVINVGPWGRDYHQPLERTHVHYTFTVLPVLLARICRTILSDDGVP